MWRRYQITDVANPAAFRKRPSLVWEFYSYRRGIALKAKPNKVFGDFSPSFDLSSCVTANLHILGALYVG